MSETIQFPFDFDEKPPIHDQDLQIEAIVNKDKPRQGSDIDSYYGTDDLGKSVLQNKYLAPEEKSPEDLWRRLARAMAALEEKPEVWEDRFYTILHDFRFVPGGRIMHGAGREDIKTTLNNCYVVGIKTDSIQSIYDAIIEEARTYKYGGGCGHDLSVLRPKGSNINGTGGESCGPVGFMNLFSENTNTIAQHGRRGANMQTLRVDHPDIADFVDVKRDLSKVKYSNISVLLTHEFMEAVELDTDFELRWNDKVYETVPARELWDKIITAAHASAEPGIIFWDTMVDYHNAEYCSPLVSTNPCGEQPLPDGGACNLGAINLARFVNTDGDFQWGEFKDTIRLSVRYLDNVIDYNADRHALEDQKNNALKDRRVGLGILGLADMLMLRGIKYDTDDALEAVEEVMQELSSTAYKTSIELAKEKGAFPNFDWAGYSKSKFAQNLPEDIQKEIEANGVRNSTILTVAPTGSGAIVAQVSSGIEPIFNISYKRRVKKNDTYGEEFDEYKVVHPSVLNRFGGDENLPDYVITAHDIDPYFRVKMQGVIQKYIDASISSTVNLPEDVAVETVADIYRAAYKAGLKGITVYREGSRDGILVNNEKAEESKEVEAAEAVSVQAPMLHPRLRPKDTFGVTHRIRTGEGTLYITINHDEDGLCEIFTTIGKAGGNAAAQAEAISRLISLSLRSGMDVTEIIKQLKGISGPNPVWENGQLILSTPDAIGKALEQHMAEFNSKASAEQIRTVVESDADEANSGAHFNMVESGNGTGSKTMSTCPECGSTIAHEGGCLLCHNCGYSKC
ncbi:MAG: adenosylcobalamin-dependent ribonucleoside-diphosphate reductase [Candidatus Marinimicrobia bacterium]|nr:adenosylcobalamin-dependent ribonucleoside-diphosphate reductase [Candidatus Neomarinimicrobiota bacterium]MCF7850556.1 adenosylcobalamin-dependent ribonucleoside-diphosphate reductase [Candidatus Neomarinimicrobiota bacterium]MCF7904130.1 adenosylcobalamin-dependent ribonucleoside-diphosphate reductase [Candidatus Neomarinimicrobiota bacterium]